MQKESINRTPTKQPKTNKNVKKVYIAFRSDEELNRNIKATAHYCNMNVSTFLRAIVENNVIKPGQPIPTLPKSI